MSNPNTLPIYKCHKCDSFLSIHPSQSDSIRRQQNKHNTPSPVLPTSTAIAKQKQQQMQCVYVDCAIRSNNLFECTLCSQLSVCRTCDMALCASCRSSLKVLQCAYCHSFICSQQCYAVLLQRYFQSMHTQHGISVDAHQSMHFFRKLLLAPHLHAAISNICEDNLPFHVCENCKIQNCGCIDWLCCVNCRKYYCVDCEHIVLKKCELEDCQCYTCCHKEQWNRNCDCCNRFGNCQLIFCTKGHCNRHIIINREIGFGEIDSDTKIDNHTEDNEQANENDNDNDSDIKLTAQEKV
eukprot:922627_1